MTRPGENTLFQPYARAYLYQSTDSEYCSRVAQRLDLTRSFAADVLNSAEPSAFLHLGPTVNGFLSGAFMLHGQKSPGRQF